MDFLGYLIIAIFFFFLVVILISTFYVPIVNYLDKKKIAKNKAEEKQLDIFYRKPQMVKKKKESSFKYLFPILAVIFLILLTHTEVGSPVKFKYTEGRIDNGLDIFFYKGYTRNNIKEKTWYYYYDNGNLGYSIIFQNGKREGIYVQKDRKGKIVAEGFYENGEKEGYWKTYWDNGKIRTAGTYMKGFKIKKWEYFNYVGDLEIEDYKTYPVFPNVLVEEEKPVVIDLTANNKKFLYNNAVKLFSKEDYESAFKVFLNLANYDYRPAMLYIERMYKKGWGTEINAFQSNKWKARRYQTQ